MPYLRANDIDLYYEVHGQGDPLVLLHGAYGSLESFREYIPLLSPFWKLILVDNRAQGRSSDSDQLLTYSLMASDVLHLLNCLQLDRVNVAGWSDGGIIGLAMTIHYPERVRKLVAMAANSSPEGLSEENMNAITETTLETLDPFAVSFYRRVSPHPNHLPIVVEKIKYMLLTEPNFSRMDLGRIRCPTLIVSGVNDELIRKKHPEELSAAIPGAKLQWIPDAGHFLLFESPDTVAQTILAFLRHGD